jgi:hypothetical protein
MKDMLDAAERGQPATVRRGHLTEGWQRVRNAERRTGTHHVTDEL